jgi:hypothetical protein
VGFTAWRELAALERTTAWVLDGDSVAFPRLYHWRILPVGPPRLIDGQTDVDAQVAYWHGARGVADRLAAIASSTTGLVLFLEHLPHQLDGWLHERLVQGGGAAAAAIEMVDATLLDPVLALNARGFFHFDAHLGNLLTDGERVYLADFGLTTSTSFDLDIEERHFLDAHGLHDVAYAATRFVNRIVTDLAGIVDPAAPDPAIRNAYLADCANGERPIGLPPAAGEVVRRYAPVAEVINAFYWRLFTEARNLPFPADRLERAAARADLPRG